MKIKLEEVAHDQNISLIEKSLNFQVVTCFIEHKGKILLLQRARKDDQYGLWGIPGGKINVSETPKEALFREIDEEINLKLDFTNLVFLTKGLVEKVF
ncbi:MAG: hypothetical protein Tsb0015_17510 [Simkaniaceae bacterium]